MLSWLVSLTDSSLLTLFGGKDELRSKANGRIHEQCGKVLQRQEQRLW